MVTFEEAAAMLDEAADSLPEEIFDKLNGGVNLLPARRTDEHGLLVMGMYFVDQMGRHIEIYYGSFKERFAAAPPERWKRELAKTLKHELTHHLENLAYDRSLERWDAEHVAWLLSGLEDEPLEAESVLFVDADGSGLAAMAARPEPSASTKSTLSASRGSSSKPESSQATCSASQRSRLRS